MINDFRRYALLGAIAVVAVLVSGCGDGDERGESVRADSVTYEGGVVILETLLRDFDPTSVGSDLGVMAMTDAKVIGNSVVVLDALDRRVHYFAYSGRHQSSVGRFGDGPGEFRSPRKLLKCGSEGSIGVWDAGTGRVSVFDDDGHVISIVGVPAAAGLVACSNHQFGVMVMTGAPGRPGPASIITGEISVQDAAGNWLSVIRDTVVAVDRPLGPVAVIAVYDGRLVFGSGVDDTLMLYDVAKESWRRIGGFNPSLVAPTEAQYLASINARAAMVIDEESRSFVRTAMLEVPPPATVPAYRGLVVGSKGDAWITTSPLGTGHTSVAVVDLTTGGIIGKVMFGGDAEILDVGDDAILVRTLDSEGDPMGLQVYRYRLQR
jgi:hypothetical protein